MSWIRSAAEFIGYLTVIGGAAYAVYRKLRPSPPDVLVHGPGASLNDEIDPTTGKKRWTMVEPSWRIENAGDKNIYNVTAGLRTRDGEDLPHPSMKIHLIQPGVAHNVSSLRLTKDLLDVVAYDPHPHLSFIYWAVQGQQRPVLGGATRAARRDASGDATVPVALERRPPRLRSRLPGVELTSPTCRATPRSSWAERSSRATRPTA